MKMWVIIPVAAAVVLAFIYANYSFMFLSVETRGCAAGDMGCVRDLQAGKEGCIPSSTIIEGTDGIILMVNITRVGDECVRTEEVIGSAKDNEYLLGRNLTCNYSLSELDNASATACPGSLYDYVAASMGEEGGGGYQPPGIPRISCGLEDYACKDKVTSYLQSCTDYEIVTVELRLEPSGYWTAHIKISKHPETCWIYFEVINAVNLPPGIPSTIIGSTMTCDVPLYEMPVQNFSSSWCSGELYEYIDQLSY
jgi:hypothetical protein